MNTDGLNRLIDVLKAVNDSEDSILGFDMNIGYKDRLSTAHDCGSACCIGGWCQKMLIDDGKNAKDVINRDLEVAFQKITGSDYDTAHAVCWPEYTLAYKASLAAAIGMLEELRDGAGVDWKSAMDMYGESEHIHE
jgi:hypothetical protein